MCIYFVTAPLEFENCLGCISLLEESQEGSPTFVLLWECTLQHRACTGEEIGCLPHQDPGHAEAQLTNAQAGLTHTPTQYITWRSVSLT